MQNHVQKEEEKDLVKSVRTGDEQAFERLFVRYYAELCRFASHFVSSRDVTESLVQDVFVRIWESRDGLDPEYGVRAYLFKAVRNEAIKYLEQQKNRRVLLDRKLSAEHFVEEDAEDEFQYHELERAVQSALNALPERRRQIFDLSRQHGLTYHEIAKVLNISIKTVETQMSRALHMLEERLSVYLD
jgi:RNA polymerase sigma-70 factor (ECF subfamily)